MVLINFIFYISISLVTIRTFYKRTIDFFLKYFLGLDADSFITQIDSDGPPTGPRTNRGCPNPMTFTYCDLCCNPRVYSDNIRFDLALKTCYHINLQSHCDACCPGIFEGPSRLG